MTSREISELYGLPQAMRVDRLSEDDKDQWAVYISMDIGTIAEIDFNKIEEFDVERSKKSIPGLVVALKAVPENKIASTYYLTLKAEAKGKRSKNSRNELYVETVESATESVEITYEVLFDIAAKRIQGEEYLTVIEKQMQILKLKEKNINDEVPATGFFDEVGIRTIAFRAAIKQRIFGKLAKT